MGARILVCDDEPDIRESLALLLRDEGYEVTAVSGAAAAVAEAPDHDVVLLDVKMRPRPSWRPGRRAFAPSP